MFKRILSFVLVLVLCVGVMPVMAAEQSTPVAMDETVAVSGDSSFGNLLAAEIEDKLADQQENNGYRIFEVTVADVTATVELEAVEDCTLVVGIYTEDQRELLVSGWKEIAAGKAQVTVQLETAQMPEYFYLKAFLVDEEKAPLCPAYATPNYTKEMQDFFATTVEDFEADRVLNLDDDPKNNFAVFKESVKQIDVNGQNTLSVNGDQYIFENADETVKGLAAGDVITCPHNGDTLILVVATVQVAGDTVTVTEADASLEDVFDYVKIDGNAGLGETSVGEVNCPEGVTFDGLQQPAARARALDAEGSGSFSAKFTFWDVKAGDEDGVSGKFSGSANLSATASVAVYITTSYSSVEVNIDYKFKVAVSFSGKIRLFKLPLGVPFTIMPVPTVTIKLTPSLVAEVSGKLELSGTLKGTVGFSADTDRGMTNTSSSPTLDAELKGEATVFVGLSLEPEVALVHEKLLKASLDATVGAEVKGEISTKTAADEHHDCNACLDGDISAKLSLEFEVKFLNHDKWSFKLTLLDVSIKVADFYWAIDKGEFGWGTCPYISYKMEVTVLCADGTKAKNADVTFDGDGVSYHVLTEDSGVATAYVPNGTYTVKVTFADETGTLPKLKVKNQSRALTVQMSAGYGFGQATTIGWANVVTNSPASGGAITAMGDFYVWGSHNNGRLGVGEELNGKILTPVRPLGNVVAVSLGDDHMAAITEDGTLYMWGHNDQGQLGTDKIRRSYTPIKVMEHVKAVYLYDDSSMAITEDGALYTWGYNTNGRLGNGTYSDNNYQPTKVMDNVRVAKMDEYHSAALTENGDLYTWGTNMWGELGTPERAPSYTPVKVLSGVKDFELYGDEAWTAAVTENGDLYTWGWNPYGVLGNGTKGNTSSPTKILSGVKQVALSGTLGGAVTESGDLYTWGGNHNGTGCLGNGTDQKSYTPVLVMSGVKAVAAGRSHYAAVKENGDLYMWGNNQYGQLGDGTTETRYTPVRVLGGVEAVYLMSANSMALTETGDIYTWGANDNGQLGDGTTTASRTPKAITVAMATAADTVQAAAGEQTATFDGLTPGGLYNFYVMRNKEAEEPFETENLLYIDQGVAGEDGTLTFRYVAEGGERVLMGEPAPAPAGVLGDVDGDETITSTDARMTLQFYAGKIDESKLNTALADVDGDGGITSTDARLILQYYAGKITAFPAG